MSNTITTHTIMNGPRNLIVQYNITADASGDYTNYRLFSLDEYQGENDPEANTFAVKKVIGYSATGSVFTLSFGSSTNDHVIFFASTLNEAFEQSWGGGIPNLAPNKDYSIRLSTTDFDSAGLNMSVTLWIKKKISTEVA